MAERLGDPSPLRVVEVGAGDGTLATQLLAHLDDLDLAYTAVERSAGARTRLAEIPGVAVAEEIPASPHVVLAHELLDNLPFRRVRMTEEGPREVRVGLGDGDRLVENLATADAEGRERAGGLIEDDEVVLPDGALAFVDRLATVLTDGMALLIDYGGVGSPGGLTHGYRSHRVTEDPLDEPGTADITAGVDFALIAGRAEARGLVAFPTVTQRGALTALGFEAWARGALEAQHRMLDERDGLGAVRTWGARSRATLLVDPAALGRFRWLVLASPGREPPAWLDLP
jgi:SAM-dependent MidA family methyltransferase